jgi:hypothetical protein
LSKESTPTRGRASASKAAKSNEKPKVNGDAAGTAPNGTATAEGEKNYWLLKAEPESRFENGVDVKFSIDDLAAKAEPEPWDGRRKQLSAHNTMMEADHTQGSAHTQLATTCGP